MLSKQALLKHGIISHNGRGGKRGMRVYPTWDKPDNKQAQKSQQWQQGYFFEYGTDFIIDSLSVIRLFL